MTALPSATVPLFDPSGAATAVLREFMEGRGDLPRGALVDQLGRAQPAFRRFLSAIARTPLPGSGVTLADTGGRPTRVLTLLLAGLP